MGKKALTITQGDTRSFTFTFTQDGVAIDITGATVDFIAKNSPDDTTATIAISVTSHSDPTNGITTVPFATTDTDVAVGQYSYDVRLTETSGRVTTFVTDVINITGSNA